MVTVKQIKWIGERIHVVRELHEPDGFLETDIFYIDEILDICGWYMQVDPALLSAYAKQIAQKEETVS